MGTRVQDALKNALNGANLEPPALRWGLTTLATEQDSSDERWVERFDRLDKRMRSALALLSTIAATLLAGLITLVTALLT